MYKNIAKKIKVLAKIVFIFEAIICIISGIVLISNEDFGEIFVFLGLIVIFLGPVISWALSLFIYAFGELVENSSSNKETLTKIDTRLKNIESPYIGNDQNPSEKEPFNADKTSAAPSKKIEQTKQSHLDGNTITCANCGHKQNSWCKVCFHCGCALEVSTDQTH